MSQQTLGAALAHGLKARGVDTIFGVPGVHNVELYRGIEEAGITHILARHEQGAGFMADGYARASGKPGVAFVITGPGLTNIMTPLGQAYSDSVSVLAISSCLPTGDMPGRLHQMRDQLGAGEAVCEWSELAEDGEAAFMLVDRALHEFAVQRARPKHITIPIDTLGQVCAMPDRVVGSDFLPIATDDDVVAVADRLNAARKPVFVFGGGAALCPDAAREVVEKSGAAVFTTYAGRGVVPGAHEQSFGATLARPESASLFAQADLMIAIGTELAEVDIWRDDLGHRCDLIRVDIDPSVLGDRYKAQLKVLAEAGDFLTRLTAHISPRKPAWPATDITKARGAFRAQTDADCPGIVPLCDAMQAALPADTMYFSDMTQFAYVAKEVCPMDRPGHWHHPFGFGTLGYALPAAIGGKVARPELPVVAIAGDYGFQYTVQELGAAAELGLTLPVILWDNGKLKEIEDCMVHSQIAPNAVVARNPDFSLLAAAYGVAYSCPGSIAAFQDDLRAALNTGGPTILHLKSAVLG